MKLGAEPLFGKGEKLYAQPEEEAVKPAPSRTVRVLPVHTEMKETVTTPEESPAEKPRGRDTISTLLELGGIAALTTGGFLVAPWLGCMILGVLLLLLGVATGYGG